MASSRQSRFRARSEVSREGAKPRSSDERRTILATPFRNVLRGRAPVGRAQAQADACGGAGGHERDEGCASHGRKGKRCGGGVAQNKGCCAARAGGACGCCRKLARASAAWPRKRGRPKTGGERGESGGQASGRGRSRCLTASAI